MAELFSPTWRNVHKKVNDLDRSERRIKIPLDMLFLLWISYWNCTTNNIFVRSLHSPTNWHISPHAASKKKKRIIVVSVSDTNNVRKVKTIFYSFSTYCNLWFKYRKQANAFGIQIFHSVNFDTFFLSASLCGKKKKHITMI